jgi:hypothetical protein
MAEVHLSGEFDVIDDYQLSFKGQLKGKARKVKISADDGTKKDVMLRDFEFPIPSLVKAELVVKGIEWLDANGKRFSKDEPQERVNARWSKVLSERVKDEWNLFEGMTYHKFRGAYFAACVRNAELEGSVKVLIMNGTLFRYWEITTLRRLGVTSGSTLDTTPSQKCN